ncbi:MAG TPA: nucleotidyltransferase family protein [Candidatus Omnitrophota bacterium]|nr:nucleotidyltransferase family protein [Candidatus Omnitrophota bacterium]HPS20803.1 nucleotidyltransferase family protein [Candidatus Omnitrophota bacterium]
MKGLILAAGYGTRLYPLTINKPKPMLEVGGKTIMERHLNKLAAVKDCTGVYIVTNNRFYEGINDWIKKYSFRMPVEIINDKTTSNDDRLGAIGDINLVMNEGRDIREDVLIMAGDNLFEFDINDFINFSKKKEHLCVALYDVKSIELAKKYGIVHLDNGNKVTEFQEKPSEPRSTLASTGIYYLHKTCLGCIKEYMSTGKSKDAPGNFVKWMSETKGVYGYVFDNGWYDIGDIASLEKADKEYRTKNL